MQELMYVLKEQFVIYRPLCCMQGKLQTQALHFTFTLPYYLLKLAMPLLQLKQS